MTVTEPRDLSLNLPITHTPKWLTFASIKSDSARLLRSELEHLLLSYRHFCFLLCELCPLFYCAVNGMNGQWMNR